MRAATAGRVGTALLAILVAGAIAAPFLATHDPSVQSSEFVLAPPMRPRVVDAAGHWRAPFVYPLLLQDRLSRSFGIDTDRPVPVRWFRGGRIASVEGAEWFPLGTDGLGRDVFARLVIGARLSLGVAAIATLAAIGLGGLVGGVAGVAGGRPESVLMAAADFVIALPSIYVALTLRASLPLVLSNRVVFWTLVSVLGLIGWPVVARGVRAIVAGEARLEYAEAARASGAGPLRLLRRHLLPATYGFLGVQATLLVPAFVLAEATLSYVGLGFSDPTPSWGSMLQSVERGRLLADAPWLLSPAIAIAITVLCVNLAGAAHTQLDRRSDTIVN
jgi:peptide/nickel transport system permease protein